LTSYGSPAIVTTQQVFDGCVGHRRKPENPTEETAMNFWDIDPNLYAPLWKLLREWYARRQSSKSKAKPCPDPGCRA
jgi:hypothetical protein